MTALMGLDARLKMARLCLVLDAGRDADRFARLVEAAFAGGVNLLQVRRDDLSDKELLARLESARDTAFRSQGIVVAYDDVDVAARFQADALHLGAADGPSAPARRALSQWGLLGRSTHSVAQVEAALADTDLQYFWAGPVFDPNPNPPFSAPGPELVREATRLAPPSDPDGKPWFAVGGINAGNLDEVLAAGARRIAVSSAIVGADDPGAAAAQLADRLRQAWEDDPGMKEYRFKAFNRRPAQQLKDGPAAGGDTE